MSWNVRTRGQQDRTGEGTVVNIASCGRRVVQHEGTRCHSELRRRKMSQTLFGTALHPPSSCVPTDSPWTQVS